MLKNTICVTLWLGLVCGLAVTPAQAAKRALVIGNAQYTQIGVLPRSEADAQDLARVLRGLGFQVHGGQALLSRNAQALQKDVEDFQKTIEPGDEVVFYFSGHGVTHEVLGNLLVPVDAPALNRLAPPGRLLQQYLGVNDTLKAIADMKPRVLVSILDACRTFPTVKPNGKSDVPSVGLQSTPPPVAAGVEQLVMYAAAHGQEALAYLDNGQDRNGRNSVFTRVLLQEMVRPSPSVNQLAYSVAQRVYAMTKTEKDGAQNVEYRSVPTDTPPFSFVPLALAAPVNPPTPSMDSAKDVEIAQLKKQLAERDKAPAPPVPPAWPTDAIARHPETGAPLKAKEVVAHPQGLGPKMVVLPKAPAQGYLMGSPSTEVDRGSDEKQHRVTIPYVYAMSQTHVTFDDWAACVQGGGCKGKPQPKANFGAGKMPVINVSHHDAREYVAWLNKTLGLQAGSANWAYRYRLPSEIETEYAARAGTTTPFYTGENITTAQANYNGNYPYKNSAKGKYLERTTEVGSLLAPNGWGLHDMAGNVYGWQADCYEADYDKVGDLKGKAYRDADDDSGACANRSLRGGSWNSSARYLRSAYRSIYTPSYAFNVGFRLTRMLPSGS